MKASSFLERGFGGLGLQGEDEAVFADGEADAGGARATEHLGEAVVAAAAEQGVLRAEAAAVGHGELEGGAGVVVEAANEAGFDDVGDAAGFERGFDLVEVRAGVVVEEVGDLREVVDDLLIVGVLAVEHAQRIGFGPALVVGAHLVLYGGEGLAQSCDVARAIAGGAHGVEGEAPAGDAQLVEEGGEHFENFGVAEGAVGAGPGGAEDLGADLPELAVAAALGALAAELWPDVEELLQHAGLVEAVLDVGADYAGGVLGAEGEGLAALSLRTFSAAAILPCVHLFRDDVGLFAYAAGEEFGGFKDGRADFAKGVTGKDCASGGLDTVP